MSGSSSANNSWTILTPETAAETLRPLAEGTEHSEGCLTPAAGSAEQLPVGGHLVSEENTAVLNGDSITERHTSAPTAVIDDPVPASPEVPGSLLPDSDALSQSEGLPEGPAQSGFDPDSFSDSYTHVTPSPDEPPASLLGTETLAGGEFTQEGERLTQEGALHPLNGEELQWEGSELFPRTADLKKQADSLVDPEVDEGRSEKRGEEAEPEVRRRRRSLLAALERIGRTEEQDEGEEEFQLPQREEDSGFSVNKCILGAVILLGLGTIFFSEGDYGRMELKDAEVPGKQEWLNPDVPPPPVDADTTELQNKLAKGNLQISVLQAQLQAQNEELKVAEGQIAEGAKERLLWQDVEKENSRLKKEVASLPVLQKENERMKRELESVPALQKELETLRSTVTELKLLSAAHVKSTTSPSSGQQEDSTMDTSGSAETQPKKPWHEQREKSKDMKKEKINKSEREWKVSNKAEGEKRKHKDGDKTEGKRGKHEQEGKQKRHSDETKPWKKEKVSRGDEGKPWKDREGKKELMEQSERKERKQENEWKKAKHEKVKEGKPWRGKEEKKDWKVGKDHGEKHKSKDDWKGEKEWRRGKDGVKESGKEKKDWREKGDKKDWRSEKERKEGQGKGERKQGEQSRTHSKEWEGKDERKTKGDEWRKRDERKQWEKKEPRKTGGENDHKHADWKKDEPKHKVERDSNGNHGHKEEHLWGGGKPPHSHSRPSLDQPEYWAQQRERLQHNTKPPQRCDSLEACAQAERLLPVPFAQFEAVLQTYLAKAEQAGVDASIREELTKLAAHFFKDGVFIHDQTSFQEFVEDVGDILEDMVEGDEEEEEEEDSALEEEMEEFEKEVMKRFSIGSEQRSREEWEKVSERARG